MTPAEMLAAARRDNPGGRFALRKEPAAGGGAVLGSYDRTAGHFVSVALEAFPGKWVRLNHTLELNGVPADTRYAWVE